MVQVFISCRFCEALEQAEALKQALVKEGVSCFLCAVNAGDSIGEAVMDNLIDAELVVILGTKTYGRRTESKFSTFHELKYIMDSDKPFFLVKMCDAFEENRPKFHFTSEVAYFPWPAKDHKQVPSDLAPKIIQKLKKASAVPSTPAETTELSNLENDQVTGLEHANACSDMRTVIRILRETASLAVAKEGCRFVWNFALDENNQKELGQIGACEAVVKALSMFGASDASTAKYGCAAVWIFTIDDDNRRTLCQIGAYDAVVKALKTFGTQSSEIAKFGCMAISGLAVDNDSINELGRVGACDAVVKALKQFGTEDAEVAEYGCTAILDISPFHLENLIEPARIGACEAAVNVLNRFGQENPDVASEGCKLISRLAVDAASQDRLAENGACEAVVKVLKRFGTGKAETAGDACWAIASLAEDSNVNRETLRRLHACNAVVNALKAFGTYNADFATKGCGAVGNLAEDNPFNQKELGKVGACKAVFKSLKRFGLEEEGPAEFACWAIYNLASDENNKNDLVRYGALEAVMSCIDNEFKQDCVEKLTC